MPIVAGELKLYNAATINDTTANGGLMTATEIDNVSVMNNLFENVYKTERIAGSTKYRKVFCKQENAAGLTLFNSQVWVDVLSAGDSYVTVFSGTQTDVQGDISSPRHYGVAKLTQAYSAGTTVFNVEVEHANLLVGGATPILQAGDTIRLTSKANPAEATPGNEEWLAIDAVSNDSGLAMNVTTTVACAYAYGTDDRMASILQTGDVVAHGDTYTPTTTSGTFDDSVVTFQNISTVEDTWTLTIKADGVSFTCTGANTGALADGTFAADYNIQNTDFTATDYYYTIPSGAWGGTWAENDTLVFKTHPASVGIWEARVIPAGAASISTDNTSIAFTGESV